MTHHKMMGITYIIWLDNTWDTGTLPQHMSRAGQWIAKVVGLSCFTVKPQRPRAIYVKLWRKKTCVVVVLVAVAVVIVVAVVVVVFVVVVVVVAVAAAAAAVAAAAAAAAAGGVGVVVVVVVVVAVAMSGKNHVHKPLRKGKQGYVFFSFFSSFVVFLSRFF